jgi:glycine hydroxymethyltransferase
MVLCGYSSYPRDYDYAAFKKVADEVGALTMADVSHIGGLIAAGAMRNPFDAGFDVVTTTTHKTLRGPRGGLILAKANEAIEKKLSSMVFPGTQGGPLMHVIAAKAVAFKEASGPEFKAYQQATLANARAMVAVFNARGYDVVSGGTDDHLFLVSLIAKGITGKDADAALGRAHITVNKNTVPNDPQSPFVTSGIRIGTPAITTRGFGEAEAALTATLICDVLDNLGDAQTENRAREQVSQLCARFPVYAGF